MGGEVRRGCFGEGIFGGGFLTGVLAFFWREGDLAEFFLAGGGGDWPGVFGRGVLANRFWRGALGGCLSGFFLSGEFLSRRVFLPAGRFSF